MVVACPRCKIKLKVDDAKLSPQGSRFKCPKCTTVLVVKKPAAQEARPAAPEKTLNPRKVLIAHSNPAVVATIENLLSGRGFSIVQSADGIDAMVKALKEMPLLGIIEVALPKIYGFEVCKRLKTRPEVKDMKLILVPSIYDKTKYRREPVSLYGADDYIEEHDLSTRLIDSITRILNPESKEEETNAKASAPAAAPAVKEPEKAAPQAAPSLRVAPSQPAAAPDMGDEMIEKARRLARTIINDIYLYNTAKVDEAVRQGTFYSVFSAEVKEGKKLYDNRIPQETRDKADFYREAMDNFLAAKKKALA